MIAAPGAAPAELVEPAPVTEALPPETAPQPESEFAEPDPELVPEPAPEVAEPAPETQPATIEPTISTPEVSFEPAASGGSSDEPAGDGSPPPTTTADVSPPPPPPDPLIDPDNIGAARAEAEAPPAPPVIAGSEPVVDVIEPGNDPFAGATEDADTFEVGEEIVAEAVEEDGEPAVVIPRSKEDPEIRGVIPRPIGDDTPTRTEVPRPIEVDRDKRETPADPDDPKRRVAVPDRAPATGDDEAAELPPLDGRFRNPGILGQVVQLLLILSAALAVAMMVALIVLNNRLDAYATSGESLSRVQSAESMVNTWMRPLLIVGIVITYALLAMWSRRVLGNLHAFNNGMDETPPWMWMMPFVNMWVLFRHLDLAWKGSDYYARGARTWQRSAPDVWTVLFVLLPTIGFVLVLYAWVNGADNFSMAIDSNAFSMIGYFAIAIGLLAGIRTISNIIDRQRTRAEGIR